jgi:hypothetical protein
MKAKRIKMVQRLKIPEDKLRLMEDDATFFSMFSSPEIKQKMKFSYKRITKILFAEHFLSA